MLYNLLLLAKNSRFLLKTGGGIVHKYPFHLQPHSHNFGLIILNNSDDALYISSAAEAIANTGNLELAISFISEEIEAYPNYYSLYLKRGSIKDSNCNREYLSSKNKADERNCLLDVLSDINKAVEINPNDGEVYDRRAYAYYNLEMYTEACEDAKKAMNLGIIYSELKLRIYCR